MKRCLTIIVLVCLILWVLVRVVDRVPATVEGSYEDAVTAVLAVPRLPPDSPEELAARERFQTYWSSLSVESIDQHFHEVYADHLWFNDTVRTITNGEALLHYMKETAGRVASCRVDVRQWMRAEDGSLFARWDMKIQPSEGDDVVPWRSIGITHVVFDADGRVVLHQDYWDAAGGMYEHLPVIGWILRNLRARL